MGLRAELGNLSRTMSSEVERNTMNNFRDEILHIMDQNRVIESELTFIRKNIPAALDHNASY